jgi:general secretion pathway protein G
MVASAFPSQNGSHSYRSVVFINKEKNEYKGFTLIELLVVVAVIAILAGITLGALGRANQSAARDRTKAEIAVIANAIESYRSQNGEYPDPQDQNFVPYTAIRGYLPTDKVKVVNNVVVDFYGQPYYYLNSGLRRNKVGFDLYSTAGASTNETHKYIGNW